jgi:hypothetical protein
MAALYEINQGILDCIDTETGEILHTEELHALQMERREKIRNLACWIKNLRAEAEDYAEEEKVFAYRKSVALNKAERLKQYLSDCLQGEKIQDKEFAISWRKSQKVEITDIKGIPEAYRLPVPDKIDRAGLKDALKQGMRLSGVQLVAYNKIQIK